MLAINETKEVKVLLLNDVGIPIAGTITYVVYDETDTSFATGTMSAVAGVTGLYTMSFKPDAAGEWTVKLTCVTPSRNAIKSYQVGEGVETEIYDMLNHATYGLSALNDDLDQILLDITDLDADIVILSTALATHDIDLKALLATVQADLDNPNQYKANVAALALEATLGTHDVDIKALLATIQADLDSPAQYRADVSALALEATLGTHDTDLKALLATVQADLDNPNQYKADVSALALEATLGTHDVDIKALLEHATYGLSALETLIDEVESLLKNVTYGLSALKTEIDANETKIDTMITNLATHATALATHDTDIKAELGHATYGLSAIETLVDTLETVLGTVVDTADIAGTVTAKQRAVFETIHLAVGFIVGDKTSLTANETAMQTALERRFHVIILDDDDIDAGDADLAIFSMIIVGTSVTDMTKINELTTLAVPIFTRNAQVALTILRMGDQTGGAGTSYGETAAQTQINITNITHELTIDQTLGNLVVYSAGGDIQWVRKTDLVAATVQLAEMFGDNAKVSMAVLPYDGIDEDGNPAPAIRVFIGLKDFTLFNAVALQLALNAQDWMVHQGAREIEIGGLTKVNTLISMLGRNKFRSAEDVFDYLVTGTTNAAPFEVISSAKHGSVLERLNAMMEKDTTPAFDSDTDSLEAISEALATHITALGTHDTDIKALLVTVQADLDNPNQYKADVSSLALEATLGTHDTDIKALLNHATYGLSALETLIDEVESLLKNVTYGLSALKTEIDANETKIDTLTTNLATHATALGTHDTDIKALLEHGTYGLSALETLVDEIESLLKNVTYGLSALKTEIDANETKIDTMITNLATHATALATHDTDIKALLNHATYGLAQLRTEIDANETKIDTLTTNLATHVTALATHDTDIKALLNHATYGLSALETLVDEVESLLKNATYGLSALKTEIDANETKIDTIITNLATHATALATHDTDIKADIGDFSGQVNLTSLLAALGIPDVAGKSLYVCLITDRLDNATYGLSALKTEIDANETKIDTLTTNLATHVTALATHDTDIKAELGHATYGLSAIETLVDEVESLLKNVTYGLSALKTEIDANETKIDTLTTNLATHATALGTHDTDIKAVLVRNISHIDFWSEGVPVVNIPAAADSDINLPDVVVPALPAGATIWKVFLLFKCAIIKDTSTADNAIDEAGLIRIKKDGDADFDANGVTAYVIEDNKWSVDVSEATERGGDAFVGKTDLGPSGANKVTGADTYNLRLDSVSADGTNLVLVDVCVGLRVYFY